MVCASSSDCCLRHQSIFRPRVLHSHICIRHIQLELAAWLLDTSNRSRNGGTYLAKQGQRGVQTFCAEASRVQVLVCNCTRHLVPFVAAHCTTVVHIAYSTTQSVRRQGQNNVLLLCRYNVFKATLIGLCVTFFPIFDIPVFWPILLLYWLVLLFITMRRQIRHMIKYRYIPFSTGKKVCMQLVLTGELAMHTCDF